MKDLRADSQLILAAADLTRGSPRLWEEFIKALQACRDEDLKGVVNAPPDQILVAQGRAKRIIELITLCEGAVPKADQLRQQTKKAV